MAAIIRDAFKVKTLQTFISSITSNPLYVGVGRPYAWDLLTNTDLTIPQPGNTIAGTLDDWEDLISLKKVTTSDISHGLFKETWQPNVVYDAYRHDWDGTIESVYTGQSASVNTPTSVSEAKCYVVTASYSLYVCLKQPYDFTSNTYLPSIYSPDTGVAVGVSTAGVVKTADGYYWKYIAVCDTSDYVKFSSKFYHPVKTLTVAPAEIETYYSQWVAQTNSATHKGGIYVINVEARGSGYNGGIAGTRAISAGNIETDAQFRVIGNGVGFACTVTYGSGGSIESVEVTNPGSGYTHASVVAIGGNNAVFDIVFTQASGLGVDPVRDLVARYMLVNIKLEGAEGSGDFTVENDYRKICLIYKPTVVSADLTLNACLTLNVGVLGAGAYPIDAIVTGATSGCKARVVDFDELTGDLKVIRTSSENLGSAAANNSFVVGETLASVPGTAGGTIATIVQPEITKYTGDILYSEYRAPIMRSPDQSESISIIVKF